jgi:hypothetical protein
MPAPRVFKVPNRLAKVVRLPGGKTVAEAVRGAEARVEMARERCVATLDDKVRQLASFAELGRYNAAAGLDGLYNVSNQIYGVAGTFRLDALAEAAYGMCDLVDGFRGADEVNWAAIDVHVDGMRLLAAGGEAGGETVVEGLRQVRARVQPRS